MATTYAEGLTRPGGSQMKAAAVGLQLEILAEIFGPFLDFGGEGFRCFQGSLQFWRLNL